jgi:hypothetical protein
MRSGTKTPPIRDPGFHVGPMEQLYELVLGLVETRYGTDTRDLLARWLHSARPTLAHMAVMMTEMAMSGTPMGDKRLSLIGFKPDGEPIVALDHAKYDIHYRPASYWTLASNGGPNACRASGNVLTSSVRRRPFFDLGREFLPTPERDDVEIALISLASVTGDLISIRARPSDTRIVYRIEDEYGTNFRFYPNHSAQPLSLGELIAMIDHATGHLGGNRQGLTSAYRDYNLDGSDAEDLVDFVTVTSDFYPALQAYYEDQARAWLARVKAQRERRQ